MRSIPETRGRSPSRLRAGFTGHKQPGTDDSPSDIDATIKYLHDVADTEKSSTDAPDFYSQMLVKEPNRANVGSLWATAKLLKGAPATQNA